MKKRFVILISICIVILICLIIAFVLLNTNEKAQKNQQQIIEENARLKQESAEKYFSDKICPQGMSTLYANYHGDNDISILYEGLYSLVSYIKDDYPNIQNYDKSQLQEYYKTNSKKIRTTIGIIKFEEFEQFVNYLKTVGLTDQDVYKLCKIDTESYEEDDDYLMFNISFSYEGKDNLIALKAYLSKNNYISIVKPKLKFSLINQ